MRGELLNCQPFLQLLLIKVIQVIENVYVVGNWIDELVHERRVLPLVC